jgi:hypothetical protein
MSISIRSQEGEDVSEFIWLAVAAYDKSERASRAIEDWRGEYNLGRAALTAISEIVSHVEVFVVASLIGHANLASTGLSNPIPEIVMDSISKPVEGSWAGRRKFIKTWLNEDVSSEGWWRGWQGFVEARNAWAHGLGRLTSRQQDNREVLSNIAAAGLVIRALKVIGGPDDVRRCARSAVEVVDWIDGRVQRG